MSVAILCRLSPFIARWLPKVCRQMRQGETVRRPGGARERRSAAPYGALTEKTDGGRGRPVTQTSRSGLERSGGPPGLNGQRQGG